MCIVSILCMEYVFGKGVASNSEQNYSSVEEDESTTDESAATTGIASDESIVTTGPTSDESTIMGTASDESMVTNEPTSVENQTKTDCKVSISSTDQKTAEQKTTDGSNFRSLEEKYSYMARDVRLEPEGATVVRWSSIDVDSPARAGYYTTNKIISEELKITKREKLQISDEDKRWLTLIVYHETCSEPYEGKLAAANVVINRLKSGLFSKTMRGILLNDGAYDATMKDCAWPETVSAYDSGNFTTGNMLLAVRAIDDALNGTNNFGNRLNWSMYMVVKNNGYPNAIRIQNNLFW
ncbi:MAG: hypothetical protein E7262_03000 [Lachnospiraceae bacterium]|nr:hypothetical protein [Lachnospiraceae bacterium]